MIAKSSPSATFEPTRKGEICLESLTEFPTGSPNNNSWHTSATKVAMQVEADM